MDGVLAWLCRANAEGAGDRTVGMGERKFTFLELHFHNHGDVNVGGGERPGLTDRLRRSRGRSETEGRGRSIPLVGVAAVAVVGAAALVGATVRARRQG